MTQRKSRALITFMLVSACAIAISGWLPITRIEAGEQEMAGIEKLHQQDIAATLSRDAKALAELWTDDGVLLEPAGQAKIGKPFISAEIEKAIAQQPGMKIVSYVPEVKELKVIDGWAYEWGYFSSSYKESADAQVKSFRAKMMRILRRQRDGSWKIARAMWNMAD